MMIQGTLVMLATVLMLGGCAAQGTTVETTPVPQSTLTPAPTLAPTPTPSPSPTDTPAPTREPLPVTVEGKALSQHARTMQGKTMLPLLETMERLAYKATVSELTEDTGIRRVHTFQKDREEVAVSYLLKDNTVSDVSFARDKMIVPVDRLLLFEDETVFAPANFFEEALGVQVQAENGQVRVTASQESGQVGEKTP